MLRYFTVINKPFFLKRSNSVHLLRLLCLSKIIIHTNVFYGKSISTNNIIRDIHCILVRVQMELVRASPKSIYSFSFLKTDCLNSWSVLNNINIHADFKPSYSKFLFWNTVKKLQFVFYISVTFLSLKDPQKKLPNVTVNLLIWGIFISWKSNFSYAGRDAVYLRNAHLCMKQFVKWAQECNLNMSCREG